MSDNLATIFLITFGVMLVVIFIMAIGYVLQKKTISGSCGGISSLGMDKVCDCEDPCDEKKEQLRQEAEERQQAAKQQQEIDITNL